MKPISSTSFEIESVVELEGEMTLWGVQQQVQMQVRVRVDRLHQISWRTGRSRESRARQEEHEREDVGLQE